MFTSDNLRLPIKHYIFKSCPIISQEFDILLNKSTKYCGLVELII